MRQAQRLNVRNLKHQAGVALFISLVLLLVLTIIGVSAVQDTSLGVRMARNDQDALLAFQSAESALRDAEERIEMLATVADFSTTGTGGLWTIADFDQVPRWQDPGIWTGAASATAANAIAGVAAQPRYIVEHVASVLREDNAIALNDPYASGSADRIEMFRITARGVGGSPNAVAMLQSTFGRVFN